MPDNIDTKLAAARTRLILDKPFLGALVLRLPMIEANPDWCKTTATDARNFYYNRQYVQQLTLEELQFVLAHEALHCGLSHFARRHHRARHRWDVACYYAINPLLLKDGLKAPPGALYMPDYEEMTAEEIYPMIDANTEDGPMDDHLYDEDGEGGQGSQPPNSEDETDNNPPPPQQGNQDDTDPGDDRHGQGDVPASAPRATGNDKNDGPKQPDNGAAKPPPLSHNEIEQLSTQWQQRLAGAAQQAQQADKLGGSMARIVDHLLQPQLPWRMLLSRYMNQSARDDYSFSRPSMRREGDAILPSLHSSQIEVSVIVDSSGSIGESEMHEFLSEIDALKGQLHARVILHACDDKLAEDGPWTYEPWDTLQLPDSLQGGGSTSFRPAFEWAAQQDTPPDLMLYFTDAEGDFPEHEPNFPVIWLVKGKSKVPWGQRIQLN